MISSLKKNNFLIIFLVIVLDHLELVELKSVRNILYNPVNQHRPNSGADLITSNEILSNEPRQFCGETLYYVVEYYCVYVKGTSLYVSDDEEDDNDQNNEDSEELFGDISDVKNNESNTKKKREIQIGNKMEKLS